jgi:hypothetical protein
MVRTVNRIGQVLPAARYSGYLCLPAELAVHADLAGDPGHLRGEHGQLLVHGIEHSGDLVHDRIVTHGQPSAEVATPYRRQPGQQLLQLSVIGRTVPRCRSHADHLRFQLGR